MPKCKIEILAPAFKELEEINRVTGLNIIASGGISTQNDVAIINKMNIYGAIIGKALYIGTIKLKEIV